MVSSHWRAAALAALTIFVVTTAMVHRKAFEDSMTGHYANRDYLIDNPSQLQQAQRRILHTHSPANNNNFNAYTSPPQPEFLSLLPWEEAKECNPPPGIPKECCLGALVNEGNRKNPQCNNAGDPVYAQVQDMAKSFLQEHSLEQTARQPCDICQIVDHLLENNLNLTFSGDSLTDQAIGGLHCELLRRGYSATLNKKSWPRPEDQVWRFGFYATNEIVISGNNSKKTARIMHYLAYRPYSLRYDQSETQFLMETSDIIVFDHGLHWPLQDTWHEYVSDMETFLQPFADTKKKKPKLLIWRETTSQHFDFQGGYWHLRIPKLTETSGIPEHYTCVPTNGSKVGYHMPGMMDAATEVGLKTLNSLDRNFLQQPLSPAELVIIPYRQFTRPLDKLHPFECTHFCHTPHLWQPIWRGLRLAMDRTLAAESVRPERDNTTLG